jgi:uncharacterized membrane protein YgcG
MNLNGVYILIAKSDHKDYIEPSRSARQIFTEARVDELVAGMHRAFRASEFDRGLLDTVEQIRKDVQSSSATAAAKPALTRSEPANKSAGTNVAALTHKPVTTPTATTPLPPAPAANEKPVMLPPAPVAAEKPSSNFLPILVIGGVGVLALIWLLSKALRGGPPDGCAPGAATQRFVAGRSRPAARRARGRIRSRLRVRNSEATRRRKGMDRSQGTDLLRRVTRAAVMDLLLLGKAAGS